MDASGCSMLVLHGAANVGILMKPEKMFWMNFWKIEFLPHTDFAPSFTLISINIKSPQYILGNLDTLPTRLLGTVYFRRIYKLCSMWACAPSTDRCTPDSRCCKYTIIQVHNTQRYKNKYTNFEFREILHQLLTDAVQTGVVVTCDCKLLCKCKLHFKWNLKCKLQRLQSGVE